LAVAVVEAGYRAGARSVDVEYTDPLVRAAYLRSAPDKAIGYVTRWRAARVRATVKPETATLWIAGELGEPQGIVVDTHVRRLSQRLSLTKQEDPVKIERDLMKLVPREHWGRFPHLLIWHGRRVCIARRPLCETCVLVDLCPSRRIDLAQY
jgi:endonuclease-3